MIFASDRVPYYVTVFFAAAGWAAVHTVDRLVDSPAIEYNVNKTAVDQRLGEFEIRASITNLSKKATFRDINFLFRVPKDAATVEFLADTGSRKFSTVVTHPPALPGDFNVEVDKNAAQFTIPVLAPGNRYDLVTRYKGTGSPEFMGMPGLKAEDSFALVEKSLLTFVARHELSVLWTAVALWLALCLYFATRDKTTTVTQENSSTTKTTS